MSKLLLTELELCRKNCQVSVLLEEEKPVELSFSPRDTAEILGNIYVGQVENLAKNIQAAFIRIGEGMICHCPMKECNNAVYADDRPHPNGPVPGDMLLVQVAKEAIKGKAPGVTTNLNFTGQYLVLTTGVPGIGVSRKLPKADAQRLKELLEEHWDGQYGLIVRTNAVQAEAKELLAELQDLEARCTQVLLKGRTRTCFSLLEEARPFAVSVLQNTYREGLEEIVTDIPQIHEELRAYLANSEPQSLSLLRKPESGGVPILGKLYGLPKLFEELKREKVWLNSGGFLVIQQTEAFVCIDVNTGKFTGKKKPQETFRKINQEAAREIARQLRLRNLSGIILIDFINMEREEHKEELLHVLRQYLKKDPVRADVIDMTKLNIVEVTRKKIRRSVPEELDALMTDRQQITESEENKNAEICTL